MELHSGMWSFWSCSLGTWGRRVRLWAFPVSAVVLASVAGAAPLEWAGMKGTMNHESGPVYGTKGAASPVNQPGARRLAARWADQAGNLWLFGGYGMDVQGNLGRLNDLWKYDPASGEWTWMKGTQTVLQPGEYGSEGVEDPANCPGGRENATSWVDASGGLWLFGGYGQDHEGNGSILSDLWKYDPSTGNWSWERGASIIEQEGVYGTQGTADPANVPGARNDAGGWTDASGALWLFGGYGMDSDGNQGYLNDLWKFDPVTKNWTWKKGSSTIDAMPVYGTPGSANPANNPGARIGGSCWKDHSGSFWLFGGFGVDEAGGDGLLDDLWRYEPGTNNWTWMKGHTENDQSGTYGSQGVADAANNPGTREYAASWVDASGALWLFGGFGRDSDSASGRLNDLWRFDTVSGNWTWMDGPSEVNQGGVYGTRGIADPANIPGAREEPASWTDATGKLWLFGGLGYDDTGTVGDLNDLWRYDVTSGNWSWMRGGQARFQISRHGTLGVADAANLPGARLAAAMWAGSDGAVWLFGGSGYDDQGDYGFLNDLWKYEKGTGNWTWVKGESTVGQSGVYGTRGEEDAPNTPGARSNAAYWTDSEGACWLFGGIGYGSWGNYGSFSDLWKYDPSTGNWVWMAGDSEPDGAGVYGTRGTANAANTPGGRSNAVSWTDTAGALWLFGGTGYDGAGVYGNLNDLWKYSPASGNWSWMKGSSAVNEAGLYGAVGSGASPNTPGARDRGATWTDGSGALWLFGGTGYDDTAAYGNLNDLWKYNPATGNWTWMKGSSTAFTNDGEAVYGTLGLADAANTPGKRTRAVSWVTSSGDLWLFGGFGADSTVTDGYLNDLWKFTPSTGNWTWMGGSSRRGEAGVCHVLGVADSTNTPGARENAAAVVDGSESVWLFGGIGYDCGEYQSIMGDLWRLTGTERPVQPISTLFVVR